MHVTHFAHKKNIILWYIAKFLRSSESSCGDPYVPQQCCNTRTVDSWPSPRKTDVSMFFIFGKPLQTIYDKMKSYKATELTGCALES